MVPENKMIAFAVGYTKSDVHFQCTIHGTKNIRLKISLIKQLNLLATQMPWKFYHFTREVFTTTVVFIVIRYLSILRPLYIIHFVSQIKTPW